MASHVNHMSLPDDPEDFLREVLKRLGGFQEDIAAYTQRESMFSQKVAKEIKQIQQVLLQTIGHIQEDFEALNGGEDPISFLLSQLTTTFDDLANLLFRNSILSIAPTTASQYDIISTQQYPIYLSDLPSLPHGATTCSIRITLNQQEHSDSVEQLTRPASDFIAKKVQELALSHPPGLVVCKALGFNEYIYGEKSLSSFQCVREAVRRRQQLNLIFVHRQPLDNAYVDRILTLGKQLHREFLIRAKRSTQAEELVVAEDDNFDDHVAFESLQRQRLEQMAQQSKEHSLVMSVYNHGLDLSSDDDEPFSTTRYNKQSVLNSHHESSTSQPFHSTPTKKRNEPSVNNNPEYGRDRTPSPDGRTRIVKPFTPLKQPDFDTPANDVDIIKIVPLSQALKQTGNFDRAKDEPVDKKHSAILHDIPDIFKSQVHPDDANGYPNKTKRGNRYDDVESEESEPDVIIIDPKTGGVVTSMFSPVASPIAPVASSGSIGSTTPKVKSTPAPTPELVSINTNTEIQVDSFRFQDEIEQKRLIDQRGHQHKRTQSREIQLNDSDEEDFMELAKKSKEKEGSTTPSHTATAAPLSTTLPNNSTSSLQAADIPQEEAEFMFGGAARSPHKRMARPSISQAQPIISPIKANVAQPAMGGLGEVNENEHENENEKQEEEVMFGGARSATQRRAVPRGIQSGSPACATNTTATTTTITNPDTHHNDDDESKMEDGTSKVDTVSSTSPQPETSIANLTLHQANSDPRVDTLSPLPHGPTADAKVDDPTIVPPPQGKKKGPPPLNIGLGSVNGDDCIISPSSPTASSTAGTPRSRPPPLKTLASVPPPPSTPRRKSTNQPTTPKSTNSMPHTGVIPGSPEVGVLGGSPIPPPPTKPRPSQSILSNAPTTSSNTTPINGPRGLHQKGAGDNDDDDEEDHDELDDIAPLPSIPQTPQQDIVSPSGSSPASSVSSLTNASPMSTSSTLDLRTATPEQLLSRKTSHSLSTATPNFFKAAPSSASSTSSQSTGGASLFNRRQSIAPTGTIGKGSLFRYQNSTLAPGDMGDLNAITEQQQLEQQAGALFIPKLPPQKANNTHIDYDDGDSLLADFRVPSISSQEQHLPMLYLQVLGADGINYGSCPRLAEYPGFSKLYVATCIIASDSINQSSVASTHEIDPSAAPRWNERILPTSRAIPFHSLLRESKIAFVLVARFTTKSEKTSSDQSFDANQSSSRDIPIAWCAQQLIHENDEFLSGVQHLPMWPIGYKTEDGSWDSMTSMLGASQVLVETTYEERVIGATNLQSEKKRKSKDKNKEKDKDKGKDKDKRQKEKQQLEFSRMNPYITKGIDLQLQSYLFRGVNCPNFLEGSATLTVQFSSFNHPVTKPYEQPILSLTPQQKESQEQSYKALSRDEAFYLQLLGAEDALYTLTDEDKTLLWAARAKMNSESSPPHMLSRFAQCLNSWCPPEQKQEFWATLRGWGQINSLPHLIPLLDSQYQDYEIRKFAVERLKTFSPGHIQMYLLQLTQCLKFEPYHNSPLAQFLLKLSIEHPNQIGHHFYWNLKNELAADPPFALRFRALLEAFLTFCPMATENLRTQQQIIDECKRIALNIQRTKSTLTDKELETSYRDAITSFNRDFLQRLPNGAFQIPLDPRWEALGLVPEKCKIMSSKMAPLWLVFQNKDTRSLDPYFYVIFKCGDDLRQDILTLQILRFMDEAWLESKLDLRLSPYNVIATGMTEDGRGTGMIQVVLSSQTTAGIQRTYGGGASGAFQEDTIWRFLKQHNATQEKLDQAVQNFQLSCVGYCVATYILGIGDRHNGNIMVTTDGHLFHIDFGHFLGNFKSKMGINRERAAFVCTPEMIYAACGGSSDQSSPQFEMFTKYCLDAFSIIRGKVNELETLFVSMVSAGLPECLSKSAILYIRRQMALELTDKQARDLFKSQLFKALNSTSRKIDNWFHLIKHDSKA